MRYEPVSIIVGQEITVIGHRQWVCGQYDDDSLRIARDNAAQVAAYVKLSDARMQRLADERAAIRYLWWGSNIDPWTRGRMGLPPTTTPLK